MLYDTYKYTKTSGLNVILNSDLEVNAHPCGIYLDVCRIKNRKQEK